MKTKTDHGEDTRFTYYSAWKREAVERALEDGFASGDISESDCPRIEFAKDRKHQGYYKLTLRGLDY